MTRRALFRPTTIATDVTGGGSGRRRLQVLFGAVLVDLIGFGIILPLLPFYAERFGGSGVEVGLLVTIYSLIQLFMAPAWGRLSDRFGRRPILIVGLIGSAVSYVVFAFAGSLTMLFVARILAGFGGSTIPVAEAYIADVTPPEKRAGNLGLIGAAFGLGFTLGPALGGITASISPVMPGLLAAFLCGTNALLALLFLPESRPRQAAPAAKAPPTPSTRPRRRRLGYLVDIVRDPRMLGVLSVYFFFSVAWAVLQPTLSLFGSVRFGLDPRQVGYLFAFLGLVSALMQGLLVRRIVPLVGEARLTRLCGLPFVLGLLTISYSGTIGTLLLGLFLLAVGYGGVVPSVLGLLSRLVEDEVQGGALGVGQSVGSLARIVGPFAAGVAFDYMGPSWPYLLGAIVAAGAALISVGLVQPPGPAVAASAAGGREPASEPMNTVDQT